MSKWRDIWARAIEANQQFAANRLKGEGEFKKLLQTYPNDGMIHYSRGEAYEYIKSFDLALADYEKAEGLFPIPHWKEVARIATDRVNHKKSGLPAPAQPIIWSTFHRVYAAPHIPHRIRVDALSAIARFDSEPHLSAAQLRSCLEELVIYLLDKASVNYSDKKWLEERIALLETLGLVTPTIATLMDKVRDLGNKGVLPKSEEKA